MEAIDVPSALQERLGSAGTAGLLELFESARQEWTADVRTAAVERFERRQAEEAANWRVRLAEEEAKWRVVRAQADAAWRLEHAAFRQEIREGFARLREEDHAGRVELLKWGFVFTVTQVFAVGGIVAVLVRLMRV